MLLGRFKPFAWWVAVLGLSATCAGAEQGSTTETVTPPAPGISVPPAVDLRPEFEKFHFDRRRQGERGTCSVFAVTGALEFALRHGARPERLSVEFLNWAANQARGDRRDGGFFSDLWAGFETHGICSERQMPYQSRFDPKAQPSEEALQAARQRRQADLEARWIKKWNPNTGLASLELAGIKRVLSEGSPVCAGLRWPTHERWQNNVLQMCTPEAVFDGHSVLLVGYRDDPDVAGGGLFIFRNSSNGGKDGMMPYAYAQAFVNDAIWVAARQRNAQE